MILELREAGPADAQLLFDWANEPAVRQASFQSDPISWATHTAWLDARLADAAACRIYIALDASGSAVGQARLERVGATGTISYSITRAQRGRGLATPMVRAALLRASADWPPLELVRAEIKPGNTASARALLTAGFRACESRDGHEVYVWQPAGPQSMPPDSRE